MGVKVWGDYESDDGNLRVALYLDPDTFAVQGFGASFPNTPRRPGGLIPRTEVFWNSDGHWKAIPYPTPYPPHALGEHVVLRGDATYVKVENRAEYNKGESS